MVATYSEAAVEVGTLYIDQKETQRRRPANSGCGGVAKSPVAVRETRGSGRSVCTVAAVDWPARQPSLEPALRSRSASG